jgi:hypothetical protein
MSNSAHDKRHNFFDGLLWYLSVRNWAYAKIRDCPHGAQLFDVRMCHSLYFVNLLSATDHISDHVQDDKAVRSAFESQLEAGFGNTRDLQYVRELRNAIIHRGLDPAAIGHGNGTLLRVLCPCAVPDRKGKETYTCTFKYMDELATHCNVVTNSAIAYTLDRLGMFDPSQHISSEEEVRTVIYASTAMPKWATDMAGNAFSQMDFSTLVAGIAAHRINQMKTLLGQSQSGPESY